MLGLPRHCGMSKFRSFLSETPVSLFREAHWRSHTHWVDIKITFDKSAGVHSGVEIPESRTIELGNLTKREAKTVARLFNKGAVPYFIVETTVD